jgi:hypothetical protein
MHDQTLCLRDVARQYQEIGSRHELGNVTSSAKERGIPTSVHQLFLVVRLGRRTAHHNLRGCRHAMCRLQEKMHAFDALQPTDIEDHVFRW